MGARLIWVRRLGAAALGAAALMMWLVSPARAAELVDGYKAEVTVNEDGTMNVKATITLGGGAPANFTQVFDTTTLTPDRMQYRYTLTEISADRNGQDLGAKVTVGDSTTMVEIPTGGSVAPIVLNYKVSGASLATPDDTSTIAWPLLQGLSQPVTTFDAVILGPGLATLVDCAAGDPAAPGACTYYAGGTHDNPNPTFHHENTVPGDVVITTVRYPVSEVAVNQDVHEVWSLDRAFSAEPAPLGTAAALLVLGGLALWAAHRRIGRDAGVGADPILIAEFRPVGPGENEFVIVEGVRPGEVGTLADERVDPVDVTATVLDLAVRGHMRITELPRESKHAPTDWTFTRMKGGDKLLPYERTLLDAVAPVQGDPVKVSGLAGSVHAVIEQVQSELYDEVVDRGWFARRPDSTRNRWALIGWISLGVAALATILLAAFTHFGLAGLALVALALGVVFVAQEMPARTTKGSGVLGGLDVLRGSLLTQPVNTLPTGQGYPQVSAILPYTIVLGGRERWLQAVADSDDDDEPDETDLDWYHGPKGWELADFPASVTNFVTTVQGTLFGR